MRSKRRRGVPGKFKKGTDAAFKARGGVAKQQDAAELVELDLMNLNTPFARADRLFLKALYARLQGNGNDENRFYGEIIGFLPNYDPMTRGFTEGELERDPLAKFKRGFRMRHQNSGYRQAVNTFEEKRVQEGLYTKSAF